MFKNILYILFLFLFSGLKSSELKTIVISLDYIQLVENSHEVYESRVIPKFEGYLGIKSMPQLIYKDSKFKVEMSVKAVYKPKLKVNVGKSGYVLKIFSEITIEKKTFVQWSEIEVVDGQTEIPFVRERFPIFIHDNSENIYLNYKGQMKLID